MDQHTAQQLMAINQKSYDNIADDFSDSRNVPWQEVEIAVKKYVKKGDKILDLGCGNGRLLKSLTGVKNFKYTGLDNSSKLIAKAQGAENVKFICDDILNITHFNENEFDVIFMLASFHHIPSYELRQKLIQDTHRILKPGGFLIMTNWNLWNLKSKKSVWHWKGLRNREYGISNLNFKNLITLWQNRYPLYYYAFGKSELNKILAKAGFKILENYYVKKGKPAHWWNGWNILTIGRK